MRGVLVNRWGGAGANFLSTEDAETTEKTLGETERAGALKSQVEEVRESGREGDALTRELQEVLNEEIPLTRAIGLRVGKYREGRLELWAPLAPNVNHKDTAFAGSLTAVATLTGWSLLWLLLREHGLPGHIVIQDCSVRYLRPVTTDFTAAASLPEASCVTRFVETFRRRGMARIELRAEIREAGQLAVELTGRYVVHRKGSRGSSGDGVQALG